MVGRKAITTFARSLLGSHYLWGSAGAYPGLLNGTLYRPGSVPWNEPSLSLSDLSICAAKCDVAGHYVCAGRFEKSGGSIVAHNDSHLTDFLRSCSQKYPNALIAQWESTGLSQTPRVVRGSNVDAAGKIVWGENCHNRRHFDCISFVNYVLTQTTIVPSQREGWHGGIENYAGAWTTDVPLTDSPVAGDILIRYTEGDDSVRHYHHIGFLDDNNFVVQAEMASAGVHADERYLASRWQMRRRLMDRYIRSS
ncbi:MAG TPA: hypothetical protein VMI32_09345 [Candidatus Solibacter sp.]|nr:hypothetical protein [Candidatus Solibacter sp.]